MFFKKIKKIITIFKNPGLIKFLTKKIVPSTEHIHILKSLNKIDIFIDVGANKGQFSAIASYLYPNSEIISFEPLKNVCSNAKKKFKKYKNITFHNYAIGNEEGLIPLNVSKKDDSSSILSIGSNQKNTFPGTEKSHTEHITVSTLQKFITKIDLSKNIFMKIDVQGYEMEVLKGSSNYLKYFNYIYVECSYIELYQNQALAFEIIKFLDSLSFNLAGVYNNYYNKKGQVIQSDFLFKNCQGQ